MCTTTLHQQRSHARYSVIQNPNHLQKHGQCFQEAGKPSFWGLSRVSNMNGNFYLFFHPTALKIEKGSFLLHQQFLKAGLGLYALERQKQKTTSYSSIRNNFFWIGARHPWEKSIRFTVCSYSYRKKLYYFFKVEKCIHFIYNYTGLKIVISNVYCTLSIHEKLWVLPAYQKTCFCFAPCPWQCRGSRLTTNSSEFSDNKSFFPL